MPIKTKDSLTSCLMSACFPAPKDLEKSAPLPMQSPIIRELIKVIRAESEPTAASASQLTKRPTIIVSTMLYICCKRFPNIMGNANSIMVLNIGPSVRFEFAFIFLCLR